MRPIYSSLSHQRLSSRHLKIDGHHHGLRLFTVHSPSNPARTQRPCAYIGKQYYPLGTWSQQHRYLHNRTTPSTVLPKLADKPGNAFSNCTYTNQLHEQFEHFLHTNEQISLPCATKPVTPDTTHAFKCHLPIIMHSALLARTIHNVVTKHHGRGVYYTIGPEYPGPFSFSRLNADAFYCHYRDYYTLISHQLMHGDTPETIALNLFREYVCSNQAPNGGRHRVIADHRLNLRPGLPAIGAIFPGALGDAMGQSLSQRLGITPSNQPHAISMVCGGNGSVDHPSTLSTINAAKRLRDMGTPVPLMMVFFDNGAAISQQNHRPPAGLLQHWGIQLWTADSRHALDVYSQSQACQQFVRNTQKPAFLIIRTIPMFPHAFGNNNHTISEAERAHKIQQDPLKYLVQLQENMTGHRNRLQILDDYRQLHETLEPLMEQAKQEPKLDNTNIAQPITYQRTKLSPTITLSSIQSCTHMRQMISQVLATLIEQDSTIVFYGQDLKPHGHYGVSGGIMKLLSKENQSRIFSFPLIDEMTLVGTAKGFAQLGITSFLEISYNAYLLEGGIQQMYAKKLQDFLGGGRHRTTGFVVRMPYGGLVAGGPTHTENSFIEHGIIPQNKTFVPGTPATAAIIYACAYKMAKQGEIVSIKEPTKQYFTKITDYPGNCKVLFQPSSHYDSFDYGDVIVYAFDKKGTLHMMQPHDHAQSVDLHIITFGNGVFMGLWVAYQLEQALNIQVHVVETPCPGESSTLVAIAQAANRMLFVDECRNGVLTKTVTTDLLLKYDIAQEKCHLLTSDDTFNPAGPAQASVYISQQAIYQQAVQLLKSD